jgi:hypothetical protein
MDVYTSFRFSERLRDNGILPSMGSVGDSYDNALIENFWSILKIELVYRTSWRTRDEAENAIFQYIDTWYNTRRIQRELGYLSPDEYVSFTVQACLDLAERRTQQRRSMRQTTVTNVFFIRRSSVGCKIGRGGLHHVHSVGADDRLLRG